MRHSPMTLIGGSLEGLFLQANASYQVPEEGAIAVNSAGYLCYYSNGSWQLVEGAPTGSYDFTTLTFTTAGRVGSFGPTAAELAVAYEGAPFAGQPSLFTSSNGVQIWRVPQTGRYRVQAVGACHHLRSPSASTTVELILNEGDYLQMAVGQKGVAIQGSNRPLVGGCGGSFVFSAEQGPIAVGGGGGIVTGNPPYSANVNTTLEQTWILQQPSVHDLAYLKLPSYPGYAPGELRQTNGVEIEVGGVKYGREIGPCVPGAPNSFVGGLARWIDRDGGNHNGSGEGGFGCGVPTLCTGWNPNDAARRTDLYGQGGGWVPATNPTLTHVGITSGFTNRTTVSGRSAAISTANGGLVRTCVANATPGDGRVVITKLF